MNQFIHLEVTSAHNIDIGVRCNPNGLWNMIGTLLKESAEEFNLPLAEVIKKSVETIPEIYRIK